MVRLGGKTATRIPVPDEVDIELDTEPREVTLPPDFAEALDRDAEAGRFFDGLYYSKKQRFVLPIVQAKMDETRQRRIAKAVGILREGRTQKEDVCDASAGRERGRGKY